MQGLPCACGRDVTYWVANETFFSGNPHLPAEGKNARAEPFLGRARLRQYVEDVTSYVNMVTGGAAAAAGEPAPFVAVHTMPLRNPKDLLARENLGGMANGFYDPLALPAGHSKELLWNNYIASVNAALRHAAKRLSLTVIDFEVLALQLPQHHLHTHDGMHPHGKLLATVVMNLLLNEYNVARTQGSPRIEPLPATARM